VKCKCTTKLHNTNPAVYSLGHYSVWCNVFLTFYEIFQLNINATSSKRNKDCNPEVKERGWENW